MSKITFNKLKKYFDNNKFPEIELENHGSRFLKLRSISRKATLEEIAKFHSIELKKMNANETFE